MITVTNFKDLLLALGFKESKDICEKKYPDVAAVMRVDFKNEKLIYPEEILGRNRNDGFDQDENFVVFECVDRLLTKGYRPEHIELEREWHLGHDTKHGRADVCISALDGSMLCIIECKTWGKEFDKALSDTNDDGAQLFSYWQQEQACKWLVLYASNFKDGTIEYKAPTIDCSDDANILLLSKKDKAIKLYKNAHTVPERVETWKETYSSQLHDDLIFSDDSVAYKIGVKPLRKKDLRDFTPDDKIVNKFEEILRHNNVSDKENAFNRLIALFICKLVDEITKSEDDEVEFQYKQGTDTYETLQDRLQRLHHDGMEKFMREETYYVAADYPEQLFQNYTGSKRSKAIEDLRNTIRVLKFYSNNDFAFKDVHNEELFYQNGKILVEMVQLFEKYRIVYTSKHQFLGDLFEQLLNKGFKQNEGQFFTPMPITRFIWDSLPVERMTKSSRGTVYPKVIDYACGAGHFLTEAVEAINSQVKAIEGTSNSWVRDSIFGIEKDYRLARVAKISLFMNGAGEGNIIFGDGLENSPDKGIENGTFDILVANPPYAVKDFKQHLQLRNNDFQILNCIGANGGEIETLFVERIVQLLKPQGIAAVVLPSSLLSNGGASYTAAREQLLKNFYLRAIVSLGSKTFGATGTNTVVLFLEKFNEPPKYMDLASDSVDSVFGEGDLPEWQDQEILDAYVANNDIEIEDYQAFLERKFNLEQLENIDYFWDYVAAFNNSSDAKKLICSKSYLSKTEVAKKAVYLQKFYDYVRPIEKEKLFYFALVYQQNTVVINAPLDNKEQKEFLGYDWSTRKGKEGIKIINKGGKLYNEEDRTAEGTLACAIRHSFFNMIPNFDEEQQKYAFVASTKDLLDFSRDKFNKAISCKAKKNIEVKTKYETKMIRTIPNIDVRKGTALSQIDTIPGNIKVVAGGRDYAFMHNVSNREGTTITISASGASAGYVNLWHENIFASDCTTIQSDDDGFTHYIFYFLKSIQGQIFHVLQKGAAQPHVYPDDLVRIPLPLPPLNIRNKIVEACAEVQSNFEVTRKSIEDSRNQIEELFLSLDSSEQRRQKFKLSDAALFDVSIGNRVLDRELVYDGDVPVYSANVTEPFGRIDKLLLKDFSVPSVLWGIDGDWMTSYLPADYAFYPTDHCGVLRCKTKDINPRYLAHVLEREGMRLGFSRANRASTDRIQGISFTVPNREIQDEVISKVNVLEKNIEEAKAKLDVLSKETQAIVEDNLN